MLALGVLAYGGNIVFAQYLDVMYIPGIGELVVFIGALLGACIGFLWYNAYPAQVFMGDTGSLALGGVIAVLAILVRKELLIPVLCGVFLVENLSVMMQVFWFKYTRKRYGEGRRIFKMAPLHHHCPEARLPREQDRHPFPHRGRHARGAHPRHPQAAMKKLVVLGAQENRSGGGAPCEEVESVFVSDAGQIPEGFSKRLDKARHSLRARRAYREHGARRGRGGEEPGHPGDGLHRARPS